MMTLGDKAHKMNKHKLWPRRSEGFANLPALVLLVIVFSIAGSLWAFHLWQQGGTQQGGSSNGATLASGSITAGGSFCNSTNCVILQLPTNASTVSVVVGNLGSNLVIIEVSGDGGNTYATSSVPFSFAQGMGTLLSNGLTMVPVAGFTHVRARCTTFVGGTTTITLNYGTGTLHEINYAYQAGSQFLAPVTASNPATPGFTVGNEIGQPGIGVRNPGVLWYMNGQTITASGNNGVMFNLVDSYLSTSQWAHVWVHASEVGDYWSKRKLHGGER